MVHIVVFGAITEDLTLAVTTIPEADGAVRSEQRREVVGGKGANPAIACAQLGARVAVVGAVGHDKAGKRARKQLAAHDVNTDLIQKQRDEVTGRVVHLVEPDGQRRYIETVGANDKVQIDAAGLREALSPDSWLLISTALPLAPLIAAAEIGREVGAKIALDLAGPPETNEAMLRFADLVRADEAEATALTGSAVSDFDTAATAARWLQVRGPGIVAVRAGDDGDLLRVRADEFQIPRRTTATIDPTGAGDAFIATLVVRLAEGDQPARAAALASAAAGHTVAQLGGTPRFTLADLDELT